MQLELKLGRRGIEIPKAHKITTFFPDLVYYLNLWQSSYVHGKEEVVTGALDWDYGGSRERMWRVPHCPAPSCLPPFGLSGLCMLCSSTGHHGLLLKTGR